MKTSCDQFNICCKHTV